MPLLEVDREAISLRWNRAVSFAQHFLPAVHFCPERRYASGIGRLRVVLPQPH